MSSCSADVAVVGAGPAGLAAAIALTRAGVDVVVLDARRLPIDKPCGEGLMPAGVAALSALGVEVEGRPFRGIRYLAGGVEAQGRFRGAPGLGLARPRLSAALARRVDVRDGCAVRGIARDAAGWLLSTDAGELRARLIVGADGLSSRVRRWAGLDGGVASRRRFGLRQRFDAAPWSELVEVHWSDGVEAYVTPTADDALQVAWLWDKGRVAPTVDALLERFPALASLRDAPRQGQPDIAGPLRRRPTGVVGDRLLLVGDAAGYVDALTGEGLTLAFEQALALGPLLPPLLGVDRLSARALAPYARAHGRITRNYRATTSLLLRIGRRPAAIRALVEGLARRPRLFDHLLDVNQGSVSLASMWRAWPLLPALARATLGGSACASPSPSPSSSPSRAGSPLS